MDARVPIDPSKAWIVGLCPDEVEAARSVITERRDRGLLPQCDGVLTVSRSDRSRIAGRSWPDEVVR
ncbi:MAG TPA: hypothetical protein VGK63_08690 [Candidatus Limnocylindrales bacterium]